MLPGINHLLVPAKTGDVSSTPQLRRSDDLAGRGGEDRGLAEGPASEVTASGLAARATLRSAERLGDA